MLRCRRLGPELGVLEADYSVQCVGNAQYDSYRTAALLLVLLVPIGVPAFLLAMLLHHGRRHRRQFLEEPVHPRGSSLADELVAGQAVPTDDAKPGDDASRLVLCHTYEQLRGTFGFCIDDFRPECFWFEPVDLLRKRKPIRPICCVHFGSVPGSRKF